MKRALTTLTAALIFSGTFGTAAMAQYPAPNAGITRGEVARFDRGYLDEHPEVARELGRDPRLVDNPLFRANHPGLDAYLAAHPGVRTELQRHPDRFMTDEWRRERWEDGRGPHPLANTDRYLDQHPEVAQQLNANPRLIDNRQFVDSHPGLHEFLATHPDARQRLEIASVSIHPSRGSLRSQSLIGLKTGSVSSTSLHTGRDKREGCQMMWCGRCEKSGASHRPRSFSTNEGKLRFRCRAPTIRRTRAATPSSYRAEAPTHAASVAPRAQ